jgi:ligand-binding SRPBCC domain-containing protein
MRKIVLSTSLPAPAEDVWALVQRPATLLFVSRPILTFTPIHAPLPEVWAEGDYEVAMRFLGVLPVGRQHVVIVNEPCADGVFRIRDAGHGGMAKTWDHLITIEAQGDRTRYTDEVMIDAGKLTRPVALFARVFYAHRQRRWHRLLAEHRTPPQAET